MKNVLIISLFLLVSLISLGQSVKSIEAKAVDNKIKIDFTISGLKYNQKIVNIDVFVKKAGDKNFEGPMEFVSGDTKSGLRNGKHSIYWDALKEMSIGEDQLIFDVRISVEEQDISRKVFVALVGNDKTPLGVRIGLLGKTSFYVEARASLKATENYDYIYGDDGLVDYDKPGYFELSGNGFFQTYSGIIGVTHQVAWNVFLYAGAGYGVENYLLEIDHYDYNSDVPIGYSNAKLESYSNAGVEIDAGFIIRFNNLLFGGGATVLNFNSVYYTASLGVSF